ncbi:hypothetical protein GALMADRAFT_134426 [Galerina marginata CBS 339.88]|uniref:CSC1/OSCA1-like 7TM region domain-containing protein n=1 Tax=Galerina marginata (strain CBS 339.88) TaxID=685588 RepID=A0A067TV70_GALM3|nr:hypothetical protein GALMADRAFT_134426 [Galerina marginata CBS 339.88]
MKRRRRGKALVDPPPGLGSRESWEFGYLYQGRSWARFASPPSPAGWPLSWVRQVLDFPEDRLRELRGLDATIYIRFLRGCFWFALTHSLTTFPILFPIHVEFSEDSVSPKSMTRASISSLVGTTKGLSLLWIHICLLFWVTLSWIATLFWICNGAFKLRATKLEEAAKHAAAVAEGHEEEDTTYYEHPHPQYGFKDVPSRERDEPTKGLRLRTIMVSNVPNSLRNEKDLQEYFEYYMSRKVEKPSMGLTSSTQPGFMNKSLAFLFNRAKKLPAHLPHNPLLHRHERDGNSEDKAQGELSGKPSSKKQHDSPIIERVVVARKMTELASLLERREEILVLLETAHIKLANKALLAVKAATERKSAHKPIAQATSKAREIARKRRSLAAADPERGEPQEEGTVDEEERMEQLIEVLGPFVEEFGTQRPLSTRSKKVVSRTSRQAFKKLRPHATEVLTSDESDTSESPVNGYPPASSPRNRTGEERTVWEALLSLPRTSLDAYQPLVNLSHLFRGKVVPSIDYYTAKLNLLTSLITENRAKAVTDYDPVSTAFVTFADPADARRACKYLAVHPNNPLECLITMAPAYQDIDWIRVMKSSYKGEFVKDWVVNIGVWAFTLFWLFPVSLLVGLVSIQNISLFWPSLKSYLDHHAWQSEVIQSFIPTLLVALLALLIPLILLLIAKKAHTITTLSALHDLIMTRYYKFLIVNVLVFFCVGTAALQSFLNAFRSITRPNLINTVASSFPTAGPFYVGWLIFTTAMHGGFELALLGVSTSNIIPENVTTSHARAVGTRPRTFNFYCQNPVIELSSTLMVIFVLDWLPNHALVIHVLVLFSVLNPFVLPFGTFYFFIQSGVVKNQLIHVYAKNYEADGRVLLIRIVRYTLDGLILSQTVFMAYMVVLKKNVNVGLAAFLIVFTAIIKLIMTRMCRAQYELDDVLEAEIVCNGHLMRHSTNQDPEAEELINTQHRTSNLDLPRSRMAALTWRIPAWVNFSYSTMHNQGHRPQHRRPNPFGPHKDKDLTESIPTLRPLDAHNQPNMGSPQEPSSTVKFTPDGYPWNMPASNPVNDPGVRNFNMDPLRTGPVVRHPPPRPWDDQCTIDLPYDNPFYTRTIDNVLWLPRNPTGLVDLDDTVDLKVAIPVEVSAGRLGTWLGLGETASPDEISQASGHDTTPASYPPASPRIPLTEVDGTEEIDLPLVIAKRVQAKEPDVEHTIRHRKSTLFPRKVSGDSNGMPVSMRQRHPSAYDRPRLTSYRSFSGGTMSSSTRPRSASLMSTLQIPLSTGEQARSSDQEFGFRPDAHAQADFVAANNSASRISLTTPRLTRSQNVSAAQAIYHEVMEEERLALVDRLEEETAEGTKSQGNNSWLTSWMFRRSGS